MNQPTQKNRRPLLRIAPLGILKSDTAIALALALAVFAASLWGPLRALELAAYDLAVRAFSGSRSPSERVVILALDERSAEQFGRHALSRETLARTVEQLAAARARAVGLAFPLTEAGEDTNQNQVARLVEALESAPASARTSVPGLRDLVTEARARLDADKRLNQAIARAGNIVLPVYFNFDAAMQGGADAPTAPGLEKSALPRTAGGENQSLALRTQLGLARLLGRSPPQATGASPLPDSMARGAYALGHLSPLPDADGSVRTEAVLVHLGERDYPSLSLMLAARALGKGIADIRSAPGGGITLADLAIPVTPEGTLLTRFYTSREGKPVFRTVALADLLAGKVAAGEFRDKIVLIGTTGRNAMPLFATPISKSMAPVELAAHAVSSILKEDAVISGLTERLAGLGVCLLIVAYLVLALPRLRATTGALASLALLAGLVLAHFALMSQSHWVPLMAGASFLVLGHFTFTGKLFLLAERRMRRLLADSLESNRTLALMYQEQGQLDRAFDQFRKLPLDGAVKDLIYSLALDFERRRQFNKAETAYLYISERDPRYKDVREKAEKARAMSETVVLGRPSSHGGEVTSILVPGAKVEKPMLGRYRIERELGKGAMGVVYLGVDPRIGRQVAIKTLNLPQDLAPGESAKVRRRFFREAESAGKLAHPGIVTVYDVGEDQDLAYIAMELLKGVDLARHVRADALLPLAKVLDIAARVADALAYAHSHRIVHRDVKPANIMYDKASDAVKVTDFGIAHFADAGRTRTATGVVMGSPVYMSPEQVEGEELDGRSDIFSLGATLYQLTSGSLPFTAENITKVMYRIVNEPHVDIREVNAKLPAALASLIDKMLAKDPKKRFASGDELAAALRKCAAKLEAKTE